MKSDNRNAQDKLKLLYILDFIDLPLTNVEITNYILEYGMMDYFSLQLLLSDLCDAKFTTIKPYNGNEYYSVSKEGRDALEMFKNKLPEYFINEVKTNFPQIKKQIEKQREIFGHYFKRKDDEYIVSLQVTENSATIFNLSINVTDEITARNIIKKWKNEPEEIFGKIINALTN
ncbi:MAG TPA: DUF4364 family protein [Sedimentibacter sp.]|nr:DUF4364 family protein [Sedimentibacter sp.]HNZ83247.1 DUF4364 family protein [Sedimentibacter sp.]HOH68920.1 DUF4364 family protein [Sedimentibacter sp.]HPX00094.1 DUF4364 family protein [Sedimentibacter sp.]